MTRGSLSASKQVNDRKQTSYLTRLENSTVYVIPCTPLSGLNLLGTKFLLILIVYKYPAVIDASRIEAPQAGLQLTRK